AGVEAADPEKSGEKKGPARRIGALVHDFLTGSGGPPSSRASLMSVTGDEITYAPLAHFPRSIWRHRSLQKGKSGSCFLTALRQTGQRTLRVRFAMGLK